MFAALGAFLMSGLETVGTAIAGGAEAAETIAGGAKAAETIAGGAKVAETVAGGAKVAETVAEGAKVAETVAEGAKAAETVAEGAEAVAEQAALDPAHQAAEVSMGKSPGVSMGKKFFGSMASGAMGDTGVTVRKPDGSVDWTSTIGKSIGKGGRVSAMSIAAEKMNSGGRARKLLGKAMFSGH